jgi:kynureninase
MEPMRTPHHTTQAQRDEWRSRLSQCTKDARRPDWVSINVLLNEALPALLTDVETLVAVLDRVRCGGSLPLNTARIINDALDLVGR